MQGGPNHLKGYCNAPILTDFQQLYFQPAYYYMGHVSRYLTPGSYRRLSTQKLNQPPALLSLDVDNNVYGALCPNSSMDQSNLNQFFTLREDGSIELISKSIKTKQCLDVIGQNDRIGSMLALNDCSNVNQQWRFTQKNQLLNVQGLIS